jgi:hypothetical protein
VVKELFEVLKAAVSDRYRVAAHTSTTTAFGGTTARRLNRNA